MQTLRKHKEVASININININYECKSDEIHGRVLLLICGHDDTGNTRESHTM